MNINKQDIELLLSKKLITIRRSVAYPELSVIKYSRKVFYDNLWETDPLLLEARGLVVDDDLNIVVHPLTKVFNRGENNSDIPGDNDVKIVRKVNGFMGVVTYNEKHGWIFSTTGSLDSDFVGYIKDYVDPVKANLTPVHNASYIFEICHPLDPHIVSEVAGAYLIGIRDSNGKMHSEEQLDYHVAQMEGIQRPNSQVVKMRDVNSILRECTHEGYMVLELDSTGKQTGNVIKMKSPYYLVRKMIARKADIEKGLANAEKLKHTLEEELYCVIDAVRDNKESVQAMNETERLEFMTNVLLSQK